MLHSDKQSLFISGESQETKISLHQKLISRP